MQVPVEGKLVPAAEYYRDHLKEFQRDMHRYAATLDAFDNLNNITESQKQDAADIKATGRQADFDAESRKAPRAFDRALFTPAIVDAHAKNEEMFRRSYGGVNLAKAIIMPRLLKVSIARPIALIKDAAPKTTAPN